MKPLIVRALRGLGFSAAMSLTAASPEPSRMAAMLDSSLRCQ